MDFAQSQERTKNQRLKVDANTAEASLWNCVLTQCYWMGLFSFYDILNRMRRELTFYVYNSFQYFKHR